MAAVPISLNYVRRVLIFRKLFALNLNFHSVPVANQLHSWDKFLDEKKMITSTRSKSSTSWSVHLREFSDEQTRDKYIPLMLMREIIWPNMFRNLKTVTFSNLIVRRFIDPHFRKKEFLNEAQQIVLKVSKRLSQGDIDGLKGLLTEDAIRELRPNLIKMSQEQRQQLAIAAENIVMSFIYSLDVKVDRNTDPQQRHLHVTCCFHTYNPSTGDPVPKKMLPFEMFGNRDKLTISNYRFVRDYTKGKKSRWMIDRVNVFKPEDLPGALRRAKLIG